MTTLYGSVSNTVNGAATGASLGGGWGALAGGIAGLAGSLLGGSQDNSAQQMFTKEDLMNLEIWNTQKALGLMKRENNYNQANMRLQTDLQHELNAKANEYQKALNLDQFNYQTALNKQAFDYNNYFLDNAYQKAVASMRGAGLNPLLLSGNSPGIGSAAAGSAAGSGASAGSASALGVHASGSFTDPASMLSASASSAQAKIAKQQLKLNTLNALTDIAVKGAATAKTIQEAKTEQTKQALNQSITSVNLIDKEIKEIQKSFESQRIKADIINKLETARASIILAEAKKALVPSEIKRNSAAANKDMGNWRSWIGNFIEGSDKDSTKDGNVKISDTKVDKAVKRTFFYNMVVDQPKSYWY